MVHVTLEMSNCHCITEIYNVGMKEERKKGRKDGREEKIAGRQAQEQNRTWCFYQAIFLLSPLQAPLSLHC